MKINERIRNIRESKGLTQIEVANRMDMPVQTYNGYELGRRRITTDTLEKIAKALEEPVENFFKQEIYETKNKQVI